MRIFLVCSIFVLVSTFVYAVPHGGNVNHSPSSICLTEKTFASWEVSVQDGNDWWIAISGQINGKELTQDEIDSGRYPIDWSNTGNYTVSVLITYQCGDLTEPILRIFSLNIYGDLKLEGPDFVCISNLASFKVSLCSEGNTPTGVEWQASGDSHINNGDTNVEISWNSPSQQTDDITITAKFRDLVATKNFTAIQLKSETVFDKPNNRDRTIIGVGEKVKIYCVPTDFSLDWTIGEGADVGRIDTPTGSSTIYTSAKTAQTVEITGSRNGEKVCPYVIQTIEPSGVHMTFHSLIGIGNEQGDGNVGAYITTNVYVLPNTVNFRNILVSEGETKSIVTGYYDPLFANIVHPATASPIALKSYENGVGTKLENEDEIQIVVFKPNNTTYPLTDGKFIWNIPWFYHFEGEKKEFAIVEQKGEIKIISANRFHFLISKADYPHPPIIGDPR